jgi:bisanhydrobacterioruberin hydratase
MALNRDKYFEHESNWIKAISAFFIVFYIVGIVGMLIPGTFLLFLNLIPFALVLSFVALAFFHVSKIDWKTILLFVFIYIIAIAVEAFGVNTGLIFGHYEYGKSLGIKTFQTPLIIGINWLFLVYTTSAILEKLKFSKPLKIIIASTGMLLYDLVLEQVAPKLDMWNWKNETVPFQNYIAWFALAVIFHSMIKLLNIKMENKLAGLILTCQFLFFLLLYILYKVAL